MFKRILLAYDGSPEYRSGQREGAELAQFAGAEVYLLAILDRIGVCRNRLWRSDYRVNPVDEMAATARAINADLIVIGHRRRGAFQSRWNKSVSKSLLSAAPCSVLVSHLPFE